MRRLIIKKLCDGWFLEQVAEKAMFGIATDKGGRNYQDDRATAFSLVSRLPDGRRLSVGAVMDGHHGAEIADLVSRKLPYLLVDAIKNHGNNIAAALTEAIHDLDDLTFVAHRSGEITTGGTTALVLALAGDEVIVANVGDCKALLSSKGAPEALSEAHNPPVDSEKRRFESAGVECFSDHIGGSDINVCRTIGDYDLGPPLKWREPASGPKEPDAPMVRPSGPLICDPEISVHKIDPIDEFIVIATDGLYDYYTPESSVITEARRRLRSTGNDPQACADWLIRESLVRQRGTLHEGTPGDNVTAMVIRIRPLPEIPRTSASRLNLRRALSEAETPEY